VTHDEANNVIALILGLFPVLTGSALTDEEIRLYRDQLLPRPYDLALAAAREHKVRSTRMLPVLSEFMAALRRLEEQRARDNPARVQRRPSFDELVTRHRALLRRARELRQVESLAWDDVRRDCRRYGYDPGAVVAAVNAIECGGAAAPGGGS